MKSWMCACLAVGLITSISCSEDPFEELDESSDCAEICNRYQDCFDSDYDTDKCADRCETRADDPDHGEQEEKCSECIEGASCGGAVFSCTTQCVGIVP